MTLYEAAQRARRDGVQLIRARKAQPTGGPCLYDSKSFFEGGKRGWTALDSTTAGAIVAVHDALNEGNRAKYLALPLMKAIRVTWKLVR